MLGRLANNLFWMARYLERAENSIDLIESRVKSNVSESDKPQEEWNEVLELVHQKKNYDSLYEIINQEHVTNFLLGAKRNDASILNLIGHARQNSRIVRTALTKEVWQSINELWLFLQSSLTANINQFDLPQILAKVRQSNLMLRGALDGTMLRNDIFNFINLGILIERSTNTARILRAKYYLFITPTSASHDDNGIRSQLDFVLSSLGSTRSYNWLNRGHLDASKILHFLVADTRVPKSLCYCYKNIFSHLVELEEDYGNNYDSRKTAEGTFKNLSMSYMKEKMENGLLGFLNDFIRNNVTLNNLIESEFNFNT